MCSLSPIGASIRGDHIRGELRIGKHRPVEVALRYDRIRERGPLFSGRDNVEKHGAYDAEVEVLVQSWRLLGRVGIVYGDAVADTGTAVVAS